MELDLQPNEKRCAFTEHEHTLELSGFCPFSSNPLPGSSITVKYKGGNHFLEVVDLHSFIQSYCGGKGDIRSMEGMLQEIAQTCADSLRVDVTLTSHLLLEPKQTMRVTCYAFPK